MRGTGRNTIATYRDVIETAIQKELDILGEQALDIAREDGTIDVADDGSVRAITGNETEVFRSLVDRYVETGGAVSASLIANAISNLNTDDLDLPETIRERL